jgi:rRNA small subunit pseudouridine methyltransferase Nep1
MNEGPPQGEIVLVLVDSELELVPKEYQSHPAVVLNARKRKKRPGQVLLDSTLHHSLFKDPAEKGRRGRPDIVHQFLMLGLDSILNKEGGLRLYVHTRNDELITVDPQTRLPKSYNRYSGLFEELFRSRAVPAGRKPLIELETGFTLKDVISRIDMSLPPLKRESVVLLFHPEGERMDTLELFSELKKDGNGRIICLIGGFSNGDFRSSVHELSDRTISLHEGELKVWTVVSEIIVGFRQSAL